MKIYILVEEVFPQCESPYCEILGAYKNLQQAKEEQQKTIQENIENFGFILDELNSENILPYNKIIFFNHQENWDNYIEYKIIEKEVE